MVKVDTAGMPIAFRTIGTHTHVSRAQATSDSPRDRGLRLLATLLLNGQQICCIIRSPVTSQEFRRWLQKHGCRFEAGHGGHLIVRLGARMSVLPMHGKQKELGTRAGEQHQKESRPEVEA